MVIRTSHLTRRFGDLVAVDALDLELTAGGVVGLVGPNGSGKSTVIRMLLGLIQPTDGRAEVLGHSIADPRAYVGGVGALVESPAFVPGLSARANLTSLARLRGIPSSRVGEVLGVVGLTGRDREPVRRFSLGMKQRLGIAAALLPDPQLLLLDEPTNGLDPAGIVEIRGLLQSLGRTGRTVVVSSHLLSEIESICTDVVVLRFGVLMFAGPVTDLLERSTVQVEVRPELAEDTDRLHRALVAAGWTVSLSGPDRLRIAADETSGARLNRDAAAAGVTLSGITVHKDSLEAVFLQMTGSPEAESAS